jgi:hypothetical protein
MSQMSDVMSIDSGPESEFEFDDFNKNNDDPTQKNIRKKFG